MPLASLSFFSIVLFYSAVRPKIGALIEERLACDNCGEWYHESCLNRMIPSEAWIDSKYKWTCDLC